MIQQWTIKRHGPCLLRASKLVKRRWTSHNCDLVMNWRHSWRPISSWIGSEARGAVRNPFREFTFAVARCVGIRTFSRKYKTGTKGIWRREKRPACVQPGPPRGRRMTWQQQTAEGSMHSHTSLDGLGRMWEPYPLVQTTRFLKYECQIKMAD